MAKKVSVYLRIHDMGSYIGSRLHEMGSYGLGTRLRRSSTLYEARLTFVSKTAGGKPGRSIGLPGFPHKVELQRGAVTLQVGAEVDGGGVGLGACLSACSL